MPTGTRPSPATRQVKVAYYGTWQTAQWANIMWLYLTGSGEISVSELNDLAGACSDAYASHFLPLVSDTVTLERTQVVLYAGGGDVFEGNATEGGTGSDDGSTMPASAAAAVSWIIAPHYRGGHPRTYIPGITIHHIISNTTLAGAFVSALGSAANAFHNELEAISGISSGISTVEHGVVSFVRAKAWRTPPVFYRINSAVVDSRIDSQRRRLGRDVPG